MAKNFLKADYIPNCAESSRDRKCCGTSVRDFFSLKDHTFYHLKTDLETWRGLSTFGGSGDFRLCLPGDLEFIKNEGGLFSLFPLSAAERRKTPLSTIREAGNVSVVTHRKRSPHSTHSSLLYTRIAFPVIGLEERHPSKFHENCGICTDSEIRLRLHRLPRRKKPFTSFNKKNPRRCMQVHQPALQRPEAGGRSPGAGPVRRMPTLPLRARPEDWTQSARAAGENIL